MCSSWVVARADHDPEHKITSFHSLVDDHVIAWLAINPTIPWETVCQRRATVPIDKLPCWRRVRFNQF